MLSNNRKMIISVMETERPKWNEHTNRLYLCLIVVAQLSTKLTNWSAREAERKHRRFHGNFDSNANDVEAQMGADLENFLNSSRSFSHTTCNYV